jgi:peptidoglycan/LPS O-acetylase OafA/YrhL
MDGSTQAGDNRRYAALDGLRGLAALGIIATHAGFASGRSLHKDLFAAILGRLDFGVALFFVLSGFLLYRPFALYSLAGGRRPGSLAFLKRRAFRILPALWLSVGVTLAILTTQPVRPSDWLHYLLLIQVYDHHETDPNLSQLWTLSAEVAFYALLPVIAAIVGRLIRSSHSALRTHFRVLSLMVLVAIAFNLTQAHVLRQTQAQLWFLAHLDWFAAGMLLAVFSAVPADVSGVPRARRVLREWSAAPGTCWMIAILCWLLTTTQLGTPRTIVLPSFWQWTLQHLLFGLAAFFIILPLVVGDGGPVGRWWATPKGALIGGALGNLSYSVYLWHLPLLLLIQRKLGFVTFGGHFWELLLLTTALSLAIAAVSWFGLERPLLNYGAGRRLRGKPPRAAKQRAATARS